MEPVQILSFLAAMVVGGFLYAFRGGNGGVLMPWETYQHKSTQVRRIGYAAGMGLLCYALGAAPFVAVIAALVLFTVQLAGNGVPIGAAGGWEKEELVEFGPLDSLATLLTDIMAGPPKQNLRLWGIIWFTGFFMATSALLAFLPDVLAFALYLADKVTVAAFGFAVPVPAVNPGLVFPALFLLWFGGIAEWAVLRKWGVNGWATSEWLLGAIHGAAFWLALA